MRICVLSDEEMQDFDVSPYLKGYDYEFVTVRRPVIDVLKGLKVRNEFDLYLNVCEGYEMDDEDDNGYEGIEMVKALEELACDLNHSSTSPRAAHHTGSASARQTYLARTGKSAAVQQKFTLTS